MLDRTVYDAFFDELGLIEKRAMLDKASAGSFWKGVKTVAQQGLGKTLQQATHAFQKGFAGTGPSAKVRGERGLWGGIKNVWRTPGGKALLIGAAGVPIAAGVGGYALGRGGDRNQNVIVR